MPPTFGNSPLAVGLPAGASPSARLNTAPGCLTRWTHLMWTSSPPNQLQNTNMAEAHTEAYLLAIRGQGRGDREDGSGWKEHRRAPQIQEGCRGMGLSENGKPQCRSSLITLGGHCELMSGSRVKGREVRPQGLIPGAVWLFWQGQCGSHHSHQKKFN